MGDFVPDEGRIIKPFDKIKIKHIGTGLNLYSDNSFRSKEKDAESLIERNIAPSLAQASPARHSQKAARRGSLPGILRPPMFHR